MAEGLTVIAAGIVVVLCIMFAMFLFIELILWFDKFLGDRAGQASSPRPAKPGGAAGPEASRAGDEAIAAIGLALQRHFAAGARFGNAAASTGSGLTPWASSGRLRIMSQRQRVSSRRS